MGYAFKEHAMEHLPKLWNWFRAKETDPTKQIYETLLCDIVRGLLATGREGVRFWSHGLESFQRSSNDVLTDFLLADSLSQELGKPLTEHLASLCEKAIHFGDGAKILVVLQGIASKTNLSSLRFLAAWTAMNIGDLVTCIDECEKEVEPHAPIYTLMGQALLESGRAYEAIDALKVAIKIDPQDILALFQLVKALLVTDRANEATSYAERCRIIAGHSVEVECLSAMVVVADHGKNAEFADETMRRLSSYFKEDPGNLDLLTIAFDVADVKGDQMSAAGLFNAADIQRLARRPDFMRKFAAILKKLGERRWYALSQQLAEKMTPITGVGNGFNFQ